VPHHSAPMSSALAAPLPCRRRKSALQRRDQYLRAQARVVKTLLASFESLPSSDDIWPTPSTSASSSHPSVPHVPADTLTFAPDSVYRSRFHDKLPPFRSLRSSTRISLITPSVAPENLHGVPVISSNIASVGMTCFSFTWSQKPIMIAIDLRIPDNIQYSDISVRIQPFRIDVLHADGSVYLSGCFAHRVVPHNSSWQLLSSHVHITIAKHSASIPEAKAWSSLFEDVYASSCALSS